MPNHCTNSVTIKGEFKHRQEFVDKNKGFTWQDTMKEGTYKELSFHAQVPMPKKHISAHDKTAKNDGCYSCSNKHWGTKWDCYEEYLNHEQDSTSYTFDTAWCPPFAWVQKVSRKFPHLQFEVEWAEEAGEGGKFMFHGGDLFYDPPMTTEQWKEFMGYEDEEEL